MQSIKANEIMPPVLGKTVSLFETRYPNVSTNIITNILLAKTAQMFTAKRIMYIELDKKGIPNHYAIIFMPSGHGKDRISNEMDSYIFKSFRSWFKDKANDYLRDKENAIKESAEKKFPGEKNEAKKAKYITEETAKIRNLVIEINNGTAEGFNADAKAFKEAEFGSMFVKNSELGLSLKNAKTEDNQYMQKLFDGYDGKICSKCIKSENREADIEELPCNVLLYSDPTMFASDIKELFETLMKTGLGRRATISYLSDGNMQIEEDINKAFEQDKNFANKADSLGDELFKIFRQVSMNAKYKLSEITYKEVFYPYKIKLTKSGNSVEDNLLKKEILSRELKALKLSCLFAAINHPTELEINPDDMAQAIAVTDMLGTDFKSCVKIKPENKDLYERVFDFFKEHLGKEFSTTDLKRKHYKSFGIGRKAFKREFDEIIGYVIDIATEKEFMFNIIDTPPTGKKYSLSKIPNSQLGSSVIPLDELISGNAESI